MPAWSAAPEVHSVFNAASHLPAGLPGSGLAQGALVTVKGTAFGKAAQEFGGYPLPTSAGDVTVAVTSGDQVYSAWIYSITTGEGENAQDEMVILLPSAVPEGDAALTVTTPEGTSEPFAAQVVPYAFGIYSRDGSGSGPGAVVNPETGEPATLAAAFVPNQTVTLSGTGLGAVSYDESAAAPETDSNLLEDLEIWVGTQVVTPQRNNRAAGQSTDSVSFVIPEGIKGCYVPVFARRGAVVSNAVTIPVAETTDGGPCSEESLGLSAEDATTLSANDTITTGVVELTRTSSKISMEGMTISSTTDAGSAAFSRFAADQFLRSGPGFARPSLGSCTIYRFNGKSASYTTGAIPQLLDAGGSITVTGPGGSREMNRDPESGLYAAAFATGVMEIPGLPSIPALPGIPGLPGAATKFLDPGSYTLAAPGGEDIGSFSTGFNIPANFEWSNQSDIQNVNRSEDLEITWTNADPNGYVSITGFSVANPDTMPAAAFSCLERGAAEHFVIPAAILQALPPTATEEDVPLGQLVVASAGAHVKFAADACDLCVAGFSTGIQQSTRFE